MGNNISTAKVESGNTVNSCFMTVSQPSNLLTYVVLWRGARGTLTRPPGGASPFKTFPGCPDVSLDKNAICFAITSILQATDTCMVLFVKSNYVLRYSGLLLESGGRIGFRGCS